MHKSKLITIETFIKIFFTVIILNYTFFSIRFSLRENSWIAGDWLINYSGGLVRRGLSGEIILFFNRILHVEILNLLIFFQVSIFSLFIFFLFSILKKKQINILYLFLLLSPATISFTFFDPLAVGRKENIFFLFYVIYLLYLLENRNLPSIKSFGYFFLGLFFVLIHEIFIFFSIFFIFSRFLYLKKIQLVSDIKKYIREFLLFLGSFFGVILLIFFSSKDPNLKIIVCNKLINVGLTTEICKGALTEILFSKYIYSFASLGIKDYILSNNYIKTYLFSILLFFVPFLIFLKNNTKPNTFKIIIFFNIVFIILMFSIFYVVNDWGRYLNILFVFNLILVSYFFLDKKNFIAIDLNLKNFLMLITLLIYSLAWHMPHCCQKELGSGIFSLKERIDYRLSNPTEYEDKTREFILKVID